MKRMSKISILGFVLFFLIIITGKAQDNENKSAQESKSAELGVYAYPQKDQSSAVQRKDENKCYNWAVDETGLDPINHPVNVSPEETKRHNTAKGGGKGAIGGAAIGTIWGSPGRGAATGAAIGAARGHRKGKQQQQQAEEQASTEEQKKMDTFIRAYSSCMDAKGYSVK